MRELNGPSCYGCSLQGFGDDEDSDEEGAHDYDAGAGRSSNLAPKPPRSEPGSKTGAALRASQVGVFLMRSLLLYLVRGVV